MRNIGYNVNGQAVVSQGYLIEHARRLNSTVHVVMDDFGLAQRMAAELPDAMIIHRVWNPFRHPNDTDDWTRHTPDEYARVITSYNPDPTIYCYVLNEPGGSVRQLVDWLIAFMDLTGRDGRYPQRCVIGNLAIGKNLNITPDMRDIADRDAWLDLTRAFVRHANWHVLGIHEYTTGVFPAALMAGWPDNLFDFDALRDRDAWPTRFQLTRNADGTLPPYWHIGRFVWWYIVGTEAGLPFPEFAITEMWLDDMTDVRQRVLEPLEARYGASGYDKMRGPWTYEDYAAAVWPNVPYTTVLRWQLEAWQSIYASVSECIGGTIFSWTNAADWKGSGFGFAASWPHGTLDEVQQFHAELEQLPHIDSNGGEPVVTLPDVNDLNWREGKARSTARATNVRSGPSTNYSVIDSVPREWINVRWYVQDGVVWRHGDWYGVMLPGDRRGFIHSGYVEAAVNTEPLPPPDDGKAPLFIDSLPQVAYTARVSEEERDDFIYMLRWLAAAPNMSDTLNAVLNDFARIADLSAPE